MDPSPTRRQISGVAETLAVLVAAMALSMLLTVPLVLRHLVPEISFRLVPDSTVNIPVKSADELAHDLDSLGAAEHVLVRRADGGESLVLSGFASVDSVTEDVHRVLFDGGYLQEPGETSSSVDFEGLLVGSGDLALGAQALVFLALGALMIRLRVVPGAARRSAPAVVAWGLGGGAAAFLSSVAIGFALELVGLPVREQDWVRTLLADRSALWKLAPWIVVVVPVAEEVFFRGYVFRFLSQRAGRAAGLWTSAALFAVVHFNPSGIAVYLAIGVILAWTYGRTSSLMTPILAHLVHNSLVLASSLAT